MSISEAPAVRLDLQAQTFKQNPFPTLALLRESGAVIRTRMPIFGKMWLATTYDAVTDLLRDHHRFVQNPAAAGNRVMAGIFRWLPRGLRPLATNMLLRDEPDHRRLRSFVDQAFLRQSIDTLRPRLEAIADEALDRMDEARAPDGVDLVRHFARPFPLAVICELLGLPPEDRPRFTRWAQEFSTATSLPAILWGLRGLSKMMRYLREEIQRQSQRPRSGLLAGLIQAEEAGDRLSEDELLAMVFLLLAAGHHTTLHQISVSVLTLFDHPQALGELKADWSLADSAADELLRHVSFAQLTKPRFAREDTEFCGQSIRRGQMLMGCLASANSDPSVFDNPDQLNIRRRPNRHLAFGTGIHVCLGAMLARVETAMALKGLFTRYPHLKLAVPRAQISYTRHFGTRALVALPVTW
ncbi:MAG: cytochrome P450 [Pirellulales bacterium]